MSDETHNAIAGLEAGENEFVNCDRDQPGKRDTHGVMMKQGDAEQRQPE
jgi:hypothetical protein